MATKDQVMRYPEIWSDNDQMNVMFSHFRQSRELNPRSWDSKMKFWTEMILSECSRCRDVCVDVAAFPSRFVRDGRSPKCLGKVFHEMKNKDEIISLDEFIKEANLGLVSWAFDRLVATPVRWSWHSVLGGESAEEISAGRFVICDVLQRVAEAVVCSHYITVKNPAIDHVLDFKQLWHQCQAVCNNEETLYLALLLLKKEGRVQLIQSNGTGVDKVRAVKFAPKDSKTVGSIDEFDRKVLKLKQTESELEEEIDKNYVEMERALADAKRCVKEGQKASARTALRLKKKCADQIEKRTSALSNVQNILAKIRDSHSDRMIVEAYEAGAEAMRASHKAGPETATVDNIMTELEELFEQQQELDAGMVMGPASALEDDISLSELEAELEAMVADDTPSVPDPTRVQSTGQKEPFPRLPDVPTFDPSLLKPEPEPLVCDLSDDDDSLLHGIQDPTLSPEPDFQAASSSSQTRRTTTKAPQSVTT